MNSINQVMTSTSSSSDPMVLPCARVIKSLEECEKRVRHSVTQNESVVDSICGHLRRRAGWCVIESVCPVQGMRGSGVCVCIAVVCLYCSCVFVLQLCVCIAVVCLYCSCVFVTHIYSYNIYS